MSSQSSQESQNPEEAASSSSEIPLSKTFQTNQNIASISPANVIQQAEALTKQTQEWISKAKDDQVHMIKTLLGTITQTNDPITQKNALQVLLQQTQNLNKVHSIENSMKNNKNTKNNGNGEANHTENNIGNDDTEELDENGSSDDEH